MFFSEKCEQLSAGKGKLPTLSEAFAVLENGFVQAGSSGGARELLLKGGGNSCKSHYQFVKSVDVAIRLK